MPGMRLERDGDVRHCQGTVLADWVARGADGQERGRGTNVVLGAGARIEASRDSGIHRGVDDGRCPAASAFALRAAANRSPSRIRGFRDFRDYLAKELIGPLSGCRNVSDTRRPGYSETRVTRGEAAAVRREAGAEDESPWRADRLSSTRPSLRLTGPAATRPVSRGFLSARESLKSFNPRIYSAAAHATADTTADNRHYHARAMTHLTRVLSAVCAFLLLGSLAASGSACGCARQDRDRRRRARPHQPHRPPDQGQHGRGVVGLYDKDPALHAVMAKRFDLAPTLFFSDLDTMLDKTRPAGGRDLRHHADHPSSSKRRRGAACT